MTPNHIVCPVSQGVSTGSRGSLTTAGSGTDVYSTSFTQLVASTDYDSDGFWAHIEGAASGVGRVRFYVGASSSETEIVTLAGGAGGQDVANYYVPIPIPAGSRVTIKCTGINHNVHITLVRGDSANKAARGTLNTFSSGSALEVDCGTTANTKGAYTEMFASTSTDAKGYTLTIFDDTSIDTNNYILVDLAVGAAGSEQIIYADFPKFQEGFRGRTMVIGPVWTPIPAGSRVAVRAQSSTTTTTSNKPLAALILWE